jgi:NAD(P)-dependent dehydrogenase (short-subunit alcohol dehydrogenase family)
MTETSGSTEQRFEAYRAMFRLDGKTALILGAASGIGRATAQAFAALGAAVICADKNREGVETADTEIGGEAHVVDAGSSDEINALASTIEAKHRRLDIAVTTPAVHVRKLMCDYTDGDYDRVADLNLRGTFLFLRAFGRMMTRQRGGSLIASSSVRATTLEPGLAIYGRPRPASARWCAALPRRSARSAFASTPSFRALSIRRSLLRSRHGRRSGMPWRRTRRSGAVASRAKSQPRLRSSRAMRRATSPAPRCWWMVGGPRSTGRRLD